MYEHFIAPLWLNNIGLYKQTTFFFIQPSVDGRLSCFILLTIAKMLL